MNALLFKVYLWWNVPGLGIMGALRYPYDATMSHGEPFEDARIEMSYMEP